MKRSFLFLQGVCSPFFPSLADQLKKDGHEVFRINFNCGDKLLWGKRPAWDFRHHVEALPAYLRDKFAKHAFTDIVLFGDQRPVHRPAIEIAGEQAARIHVFEEGYIRPHWVTLEREGVNGHSLLPRDPAWYLATAKRLGPPPPFQPIHQPLKIRAAHDTLYHLANLGNPIRFPGYRTHRPCIAGLEYAGWGKRFSTLPYHSRANQRFIERLIASKAQFFILPLQLNSDAQIVKHSSFTHMSEVIRHVLKSFAKYAPAGMQMVVKNHPLDTGFVSYPRLIRRLEHELGIAGRVHYIETGNLEILLEHARGVVTVNSTVGTVALAQRCPVICLSDPIYNISGLTHQGTLDAFWNDPRRPDAKLFEAFRTTLLHTVMANGGFYTQEGIKLAVENCRRLLEPDCSPLEALL